jgi:hypothetical protein
MSLLDTASLIVTPNGYKEGKLYSVIPSDGSGDLSVTRATTATRVNSAGLVELVPYNLLSYSEDFSNSIWNKTALSISTNSTTAPNGSTTADTITNSSSSGIILQTYSSVNTSQIVTHSVYLKRTNNDWAVLAIARSGATTYGEMYVWFNLSTGVVGGNLPDGSAVILDTEIENVGNGWYRCSVTGYVPNAVAYTAFMLYPDGNNSFTRVTGQSVYAWGAQLVEGSTAKDYQKTETRLNIPRLDYSNGTCPSLLVEPQRTNLIFPSNGSTSNAFNGTFVANAATSPQGVNNASSFVSTGGASGVILTTLSTSAQSYSFSVYLKGSVNGQKVRVFGDLNGTIQNFTLTTEWERYEVTFTGVVGTQSIYLLVGTYFSPAETNLFYFYGAQAEIGSYSTSYIPTTSASVTRNADVISKTGISSLIGQTEGTLFIDTYIENISAQTNDPVLIYLKGSSAEVYIEVYDTGAVYGIFYDGSSVQCGIFANIGLTNGRHKMGFGYKNNDFVLYVDGVQVGTDTSGTVSGSLTEFGLQYYQDFYRGTQDINSAALWKTRLTNTQLAALTTL